MRTPEDQDQDRFMIDALREWLGLRPLYSSCIKRPTAFQQQEPLAAAGLLEGELVAPGRTARSRGGRSNV